MAFSGVRPCNKGKMEELSSWPPGHHGSTARRHMQSIHHTSSSYSSPPSPISEALLQPACLPISSSSSSWQGNAARLPSSSDTHSTAADERTDNIHQQRGQHRGRYEYLQLIDDLRASAKVKAEIVAHPLFHNLMQAHVECVSVGVPWQQLPALDAVQLARMRSVMHKYVTLGSVDPSTSSRAPAAQALIRPAEIDAFMVSSAPFLFC
ncbi:hypothetical protein GOP47_0012884 [Adiantum capillus-veneris]|uniref:KNOX1 domain-containing protein n=1 Tax=Adiantum capillus-veneris TaxID=13818 RepID=A0A9D4URJ5_ADICA|nr:hypothetical protein GOP47_0012884 [Adiantum capillus-veneris]